MIQALHISTECYPAAKAGGMGDVLGTLPRYMKPFGVNASVLIPRYDLPWFQERDFEEVFSGSFQQWHENIHFSIQKLRSDEMGFDFYCADIPGKFDRNSVYLDIDGEGYKDEAERNIAFQRAALLWMNSDEGNFDIIHCHDHQTGLIPFFMSHGYDFVNLRDTPSVFTIHNAAYYGMFHWFHRESLPPYNDHVGGLLDWDGHIHSLASAVKCAKTVNTVSPSYMEEIKNTNDSLSKLFQMEGDKCIGILNGIDNDTWDTKTDPLIKYKRKGTWNDFKDQNKKIFAEEYGLNPDLPWYSFIGRFSDQKGVDIIPGAITKTLEDGKEACFIILGSGSKELEQQINNLEEPGKIKALIMYNEAVAHQIYAASDFLLMPSRFEPCGLNQMFSMRYGTVPVVRATGGLIDTVHEDPNQGTGFMFDECTTDELAGAIRRSWETYHDKNAFGKLRNRCVRQNFSWEKSAEKYVIEYKKLL